MNGTLRILCLGASTTDQSTQSWPDTWCGRLETELDRAVKGRVRIEAAAYGRGGDGVRQAAIALARLLPAFEPDIVVVLLGVNDVTWRRGTRARATAESRDDLTCADGIRPLDGPSLELPRLLWKALGRATRARHGEGGRVLEWHSDKLPEVRLRFALLPERVPPIEPAIVQRFVSDLERLVRLARDSGADVVLLGQPVLWKETLSVDESARLWFLVRTNDGFVRAPPAWLLGEMRRFNDAQRQLARRLDVPFVDLEPRIPKDLEHFIDDCHFTDAGSARVAEELLPAARRLVEERVGRRTAARSGS